MIYGINERKGFISITGEVGVGKTTLIYTLLNNLNEKVKTAFIYHTTVTFEQLLAAAAKLDLAYLHVIRMPDGGVDNIALGQRFFGDRLVVNDSYDFEEASAVVSSRAAAAVSFGRPFIANPDLVERFREGAELARFDPHTLYAGGSRGYSDYPRRCGEPA